MAAAHRNCRGRFLRRPAARGATCTALGRILHDWSEDKILKLLAQHLRALPAGGGLLIAEKLLTDDKTGPRWAQMQDLNMLTCTEGKERTLAEYRALLTEAGFSRRCRAAARIRRSTPSWP